MKSITFKVSKSGIYHFKNFIFNKNGLIDPQIISFLYSKNEDCPVIDKESTADEVLVLLKEFAYGNKAYVFKKDNLPVLVNNDMVSAVDKSIEIIEETIKQQTNKLFKEHLNKILGDYKIDFLDILILKNKKYVSISDDSEKHYAVNYLCYKLLYALGKVKYDNFSSETGYIQNYFDYFIGDIEENA